MNRHQRFGVIVGVGIFLLISVVGFLSWKNPTIGSFALLPMLPALPIFFLLMQIFPLPFGEAEYTSRDFIYLMIGSPWSAALYGIIAFQLSRAIAKSRSSRED